MGEAIKTVTKRIERTDGDTYPIEVTIKVNGAVVDITDDTLTFVFSNEDSAESPTTITGDITNGAGGVVEFVPTAEQMIEGEYDFWVKRDHDGEIATHLRGDLVLLP